MKLPKGITYMSNVVRPSFYVIASSVGELRCICDRCGIKPGPHRVTPLMTANYDDIALRMMGTVMPVILALSCRHIGSALRELIISRNGVIIPVHCNACQQPYSTVHKSYTYETTQ